MKPFLPSERSPALLSRSVMRGLAGIALGALRDEDAENIVTSEWHGDNVASWISRTASESTSLANFGLSTSRWAVLEALANESVAVAIFGQSARVDMTGAHFVIVPSVIMPSPVFVGEGAPHPIVNGIASMQSVGPVHKMQLGAAITNELEFATPENASTVIGRAIKDQANISLDAEFLSATAASDIRDSGVLNGVVPIAASVETDAMIEDIAALAGALSAAKCNADRAIYIAHPVLATKLRLLAGPRFTNLIFSSNALAVGQIVAIDPWALASGFTGIPEITISKHGTAHFEDTTPLAIGTAGSPNTIAAPVFSAFQTNSFLLKVTTRLCWKVLVAGGVQTISGAAW